MLTAYIVDKAIPFGEMAGVDQENIGIIDPR